MHESPAAWWQHAGHAALQECRLISRHQASFSGTAQRRANRQLYQARLYCLLEQGLAKRSLKHMNHVNRLAFIVKRWSHDCAWWRAAILTTVILMHGDRKLCTCQLMT